MKKRFLSKSLIAKIALVLVMVILFEFAVSQPVAATEAATQWGGTLLSPIVNLVVYLADGVIQIMQSALTDIEQSFETIDLGGGARPLLTIIGAVIVVGIIALVAGLAVVFAPAAIPAVIVKCAPAAISFGLSQIVSGGAYLAVYQVVGKPIDEAMFGNTFVYSNIYFTPETILKGQIKLLNVNFIEKVQYDDAQVDNTGSLADGLRTIVSQVYVTIRDVALVAMIIVMIYIAIKMLLSLTPKEKSRYKESAVNCIIGLVLIVFMHIIMSVSITTLMYIINSISFSNQIVDIPGGDSEANITDYLKANPDVYNNCISGATLEIVGEELYKKIEDDQNPGKSKYPGMVLGKNDDGDEVVYIKTSNFTEQARYMAQKRYEIDSDDNRVGTWEHIGWSFVYIMLVILTVAFFILYAKRALYMAVLTMFAPIVGLMYPINRANGGRAHTLNLWFREYLGNIVIQPFHLLLYTIFIGGVMNFAINNPIFVIIALMGILFVEAFLRDLLGIQNTRAGGLAKALQDTTKAIKTTTSAAKTVAKTAARGIDRAANAAGRAGGRLASYYVDEKFGENKEEESTSANNPIREQRPLPTGPNGGGDDPLPPPPPEGGGELYPSMEANSRPQQEEQAPDPLEGQEAARARNVSGDIDEEAAMQKYMSKGGSQNAYGEYFNPYTDEYDADYNPLSEKEYQVFKDGSNDVKRQLDKEATMQKYMSEGGSQNAYGEYYNPYTDEYDAGYNPLSEKEYQVFKAGSDDTKPQLDEVKTLENYKNAGYTQNAKGEFFNPYTDEYDKTYSPLRDNLFMEYRNTGIGEGTNAAGAVDDTTMSMVDKLNNKQPQFSTANRERLIRSERGRNVYRDNDGRLRIEPSMPNDRAPGTMKMAAGAEMGSGTKITEMGSSTSNLNNAETNTVRTSSSRGRSTMSNSGATSLGTGGASQSTSNNNSSSDIGENRVNPRDNFNVLSNPNEPNPSSGERPEFTVKEGGKGKDVKLDIPEDVINEPQNIDNTSKVGSGSEMQMNDNMDTGTINENSTSNKIVNFPSREAGNNALDSNLTGRNSGEETPGNTNNNQAENNRSGNRAQGNRRSSNGGDSGNTNNNQGNNQAENSGSDNRAQDNRRSSNGRGSGNANNNQGNNQAENNGSSNGSQGSRRSSNGGGSGNANNNQGNNQAENNGSGNRAQDNRRSSNGGGSGNANNNQGSNQAENSGSGNRAQDNRRSSNGGSSGNANNNQGNNQAENNGSDNRAQGNRRSSNDGSSGNANNNQGNNQAENSGSSNRAQDNRRSSNDGSSGNANNNSEAAQKAADELKTLQRVKKVVEGAQKGMDIGGKVVERTTGVVAAGVEGVIDTALNAISGNVAGAVETPIETAQEAFRIATGGQTVSRSSSKGNSSNNSSSSRKSSDEPQGWNAKAQNVRTIMSEAGMTKEEASAFEERCRVYGIPDDRNMGLIGKVYKGASSSDKEEILRVSKVLYEMRRNGKSKKDAVEEINNARLSSSSIRDSLEKMYDKLHSS